MARTLQLAWFAPLCALMLAPGAGRADANDSVDDAMIRLVEKLKPTFDGRNVRTVSVGQFEGPALTSGGPEIQLKLGQALEEAGFERDDFEYDIRVRGRYEQNENRDSNGQLLLTVRIVAQLFDPDGRPILEFNVDGEASDEVQEELFGTESVPRLLGISSTAPPNLQEPDRSEQLLEDQQSPPCTINGTIVWADESETFGIEILVEERTTFTPREPTERTSRQLPFVPIEPTEVYQIRLINNADHEAAVQVTIDGINIFAFSETDPQPNYRIIAPHSSTIVRGWDRNERESYEFLVTGEFPETAAARLQYQPNENMGAICAQFSASWEEGGDPPSDEPRTYGSRGTALGDIIEEEKVLVARHIGNVRATVHVRYER